MVAFVVKKVLFFDFFIKIGYKSNNNNAYRRFLDIKRLTILTCGEPCYILSSFSSFLRLKYSVIFSCGYQQRPPCGILFLSFYPSQKAMPFAPTILLFVPLPFALLFYFSSLVFSTFLFVLSANWLNNHYNQ